MTLSQNSLCEFGEEAVPQDSKPSSHSESADNSPWPETLPESLKVENYPPIVSSEPLTESGPASNICPGDVDCYRTQSEDGDQYFGFLILQRSRDKVSLYVLHTKAYSTTTIDAFENWPDSEDSLETPTRKIYSSVVSPRS